MEVILNVLLWKWVILVKLVCPIHDVLKKTSLVFSQGGIVIKYLVYFKFITTNMDIKTFARVHVNLKLSGNEKFAVYGAIVKILANFKSSSAKACYLMVNINGGKYQWLQYH